MYLSSMSFEKSFSAEKKLLYNKTTTSEAYRSMTMIVVKEVFRSFTKITPHCKTTLSSIQYLSEIKV